MIDAGRLLFSSVACSFLASFQAPPPMTNLVQHYPFGEQLSLEVTPDRKLAFVAEGAAITVLDVGNIASGTPPVPLLPKVRVPDCQPLAMAFYEPPAPPGGGPYDRYLFIAGGSHGVWRLTLCPSLFPTPPLGPTSCGAESSYQPTHIPGVNGGNIEGGYFEKKRCVDVAILHREENDVLFALYAASSDPQQSGIGATELHAWRLSGGSVTDLAVLTFDPTAPGAPHAQVGTALAIDPGDDDSVYVALGKGGIWRVDLSLGPPASLSKTLLVTNTDFCSQPSPCAFTHPAPCFEDVRDLAVLRTGTGTGSRAFLYAALSYKAILEYELTASSPTPTFVCITPNGYPERIAAVNAAGAGGTGPGVLLAVATEVGRGASAETWAPFTVNGRWWDICLGWHTPDPDDPGTGSSCNATPCAQILFYWRDLAPASSGQLIPLGETIPFPWHWGSLILRQVSSNEFHTFACSTEAGTKLHKIVLNSSPTTPSIQTPIPSLGDYIGTGALGAGHGTTSLINPEILRFGWEKAGAVEYDGTILWIDKNSPFTMQPIPETKSFCIPDVPLPCPTGDCRFWEGLTFAGNILDEPHWIDPTDPSREIFVTGGTTVVRIRPTSTPVCECTTVLDECSGDPCSPSQPIKPIEFATGALPNAPVFSGTPSTVGWRIVSQQIPTGWPASGSNMLTRWRQFASPLAPASPPVDPGEQFTPTMVYVTGVQDPRPPLSDGNPRALYLVRGGSSHIRAVRPRHLLAEAAEPCPILSNRGYGESIQLDPSLVRHAMSHVELERDASGNTQCNVLVPCNLPYLGQNPARNLFNNRAEVFETRDPSGNVVYVLAVVTGFAATGPSTPFYQQLPSCLWAPYALRPMLALFDVTQTGTSSFLDMHLLRVGVGWDEGNAWALRIKTYGTGVTAKTYAFVGDVMGKLLVFDVSTDQQLFPPATQPYLSGTPGNLSGTKILQPVSTLAFPKDPFDGEAHNVIDLALDGDFLYCALARGGVGIVDVSNPAGPFLAAVLDTPGLVMGLAIRTAGSPPEKQLVVGDSRCGVRLYH